MFLKKELSILVNDKYFHIIQQTDNYIEFMSNNTNHCWIIHKSGGYGKYPYMLYHKHQRKTPYYHKHWLSYSVQDSIKSIKSHDDYILSK